MHYLICMTSPSSDAEPAEAPPGILEARAEIDRIDAEIVRLLSIRLSTVLRAYQVKRAAGMSLKDEDREEQIIDRALERAAELDLPKKQIRKIFRQILRISEKAQ